MNWASEIQHALRADPILQAVVGNDSDGETKIYGPNAKSNIVAPYVVFSIIPTQEPIRAYGDDEAIHAFRVAIASWARDSGEAWQLADVTDDALKRADYSFEPYQVMNVLRVAMPQELQDRDTLSFYLTVQYQFNLGR